MLSCIISFKNTQTETHGSVYWDLKTALPHAQIIEGSGLGAVSFDIITIFSMDLEVNWTLLKRHWLLRQCWHKMKQFFCISIQLFLAQLA